jgi:hypothetical protein
MLVGACVPRPVPLPTASNSPLPTVTAPFVPATPTAAPLATSTPTLAASQTPPAPTETARPTLGPSRTVGPATANAWATIRPIVSGRSSSWSALSPDGHWVAYGDWMKTGVVRISDGKEWSLSYVELYGQSVGSIDGYLFADHWTQDGRFLYLAVLPQFDGCRFFVDGAMLLRLNLETGAVTEVLPRGSNWFVFYAFSFAPNDSRLAYIQDSQAPLAINLVHMATGTRTEIALGTMYSSAGSMLWSPDGQRLALAATVGAVSCGNDDRFAVAVLALDGHVVEVVPPSNLWLDPVTWVDEGTLLLNQRRDGDAYWSLDLDSGVMVEAEPP